METMQPTLKNGRNVWDRINMPEDEFNRRLKKVRREMKKEGIDLLFLYGNGFNEYGNYCYLSNYMIRLPRGALVVVPQKGELTLIFEGASRGVPSVRKTTWIEEIRPCGEISKECVKYLEEKKLTPSTLGFVGLKQLMPNDQWQFLLESLPQYNIIDSNPLLKEMRMIKSQRETDQIRRSSRILVHAFDFIAQAAFSECNERELEARLRREARLEGAEDFRMLIAKPREERWAFRLPEETEIFPEETVILYLAVQLERYWAEAVRTFMVKEKSFVSVKRENLETLYGKVIEGFRPGKTASQFHDEAIVQIRKEGAEYISGYGLGQGIGLSPREHPLIFNEDKTPLKEGMCLTLRLLLKEEGLGAMMIGNTLHLTKKGPEVLTQ
ncbi:MAG: hypothetical protein A2169_08125 [Deltaproteobacteria bacterium RBG_13_47_9]|nr:MAG: hypothetical protein A2169_08125 [Deltaproteobacteria bacterium RBG_13_47_9]